MRRVACLTAYALVSEHFGMVVRRQGKAGGPCKEMTRLLVTLSACYVFGTSRLTLCSNPCLTASKRAIGKPWGISARAVSNALSASE